MKPADDWNRWAQTWQQQPSINVDQLRQQVRRKQWRMRIFIVWRVIGAIIVVTALTRLQMAPGIPIPMRVWGGIMLPLFALIFYMRVRQYRGIWNAASEGTVDLLRLTAKRARAGIRLAWTNVAAIILISVVSLSFAAPYLMPVRWLHDPNVRHVLAPLIATNGAIAIAALVINASYMHRQRARLHHVEALLAEVTDLDGHPN